MTFYRDSAEFGQPGEYDDYYDAEYNGPDSDFSFSERRNKAKNPGTALGWIALLCLLAIGLWVLLRSVRSSPIPNSSSAATGQGVTVAPLDQQTQQRLRVTLNDLALQEQKNNYLSVFDPTANERDQVLTSTDVSQWTKQVEPRTLTPVYILPANPSSGLSHNWTVYYEPKTGEWKLVDPTYNFHRSGHWSW